jgi:2-iminoacetate synthase
MATKDQDLKEWAAARIRPEEIKPYLDGGNAIVDAEGISAILKQAQAPDEARLQAMLAKALSGQGLGEAEAAALLAVTDPGQRQRVAATAQARRRQAFGDRVKVFAPLFLGNACVNACSYCGFRDPHQVAQRRVLNEAEVNAEVEVLAGELGHGRVLAVAGEHPSSDAGYIAGCVAAIKAVQASRDGRPARIGHVALNAPPMPLADLRALAAAGIDAYHVYQETYDSSAYAGVHPAGPKADFQWRLTALHRALDAGVPQVGLGFLTGLSDHRFESLAILQHAASLQARFGRGPATISLQRLAPGHPMAKAAQKLDDEGFLHLVAVLRLALPAVGIIVPSCEGEALRRRALGVGASETDASTTVGVGAFHEGGLIPSSACRQFAAGQGGTLEELTQSLRADGLTVHAD